MNGAKHRGFLVMFLGPAVLIYGLIVAIPAVRALLYSLQKWNGFSEPEWAGLANFAVLFNEGSLFWAALRNNAIILLAGGGGVMALSLLFAALIHRRVRGAGLFRVSFFFPNILAAVAVALLWTLLYSTTEFGPINAFLAAVQSGLGIQLFETPVTFMHTSTLVWALVPMLIWAMAGFYMVLFLAAMENIPESYYEAARLEGASGWSQFVHITLPLIREVMVVGLIFLAISSLKLFDPIWVMESGQPQRESHVLATLVYQQAFSEFAIGEGAAVAVVLFALVFAISYLALRLSRREAVEY